MKSKRKKQDDLIRSQSTRMVGPLIRHCMQSPPHPEHHHSQCHPQHLDHDAHPPSAQPCQHGSLHRQVRLHPEPAPVVASCALPDHDVPGILLKTTDLLESVWNCLNSNSRSPTAYHHNLARATSISPIVVSCIIPPI